MDEWFRERQMGTLKSFFLFRRDVLIHTELIGAVFISATFSRAHHHPLSLGSGATT